MWHKPCRTFHPWCPCIKTRCLCDTVVITKSAWWLLMHQGICNHHGDVGWLVHDMSTPTLCCCKHINYSFMMCQWMFGTISKLFELIFINCPVMNYWRNPLTFCSSTFQENLKLATNPQVGVDSNFLCMLQEINYPRMWLYLIEWLTHCGLVVAYL